MNTVKRTALAVFFACALLVQGCSKDEQPEIKEEVKAAGNSIQKAYDKTTGVMKDVVEGVNDAVYK